MKCINCHSQNLRKIFSLGEQPISSIFYKTKKLKLKKYPLILYECGKCKLVQFSQKTPVNEIYGTNYAYKTALSSDMIKHLYEKYKKLQSKNMTFIGRCGLYAYLDMHQAINSSLAIAKRFKDKK